MQWKADAMKENESCDREWPTGKNVAVSILSILTVLTETLFLIMVSPAHAAGIPQVSNAALAVYVVEHLDVRSIESSIGPRRQATRIVFGDYGFVAHQSSAGEVKLTTHEQDWYFTVRILERNSESILICLTDEAANGGTYRTSHPLLLVMTSDGRHLLGQTYDAERTDCPLWPPGMGLGMDSGARSSAIPE